MCDLMKPKDVILNVMLLKLCTHLFLLHYFAGCQQ